jgi:threonine dehydrogenase-like Zn-dependent dehydrogenase
MSSSDSNLNSPAETPRRTFLKTSAALAVAGSVATTMTGARAVHAAGSDTLKVALIGCGGRGSGAATDAMAADKNAKITVLADAFGDRVEFARNALKAPLGDQLDVKPENCFVGIDAYKQVMASDVDVVLLCSPPGFRTCGPRSKRASMSSAKSPSRSMLLACVTSWNRPKWLARRT